VVSHGGYNWGTCMVQHVLSKALMHLTCMQDAPAAMLGWKRRSIMVPSDAESSMSRRLSPSGAGSSMS
jgi:hypothetical protein